MNFIVLSALALLLAMPTQAAQLSELPHDAADATVERDPLQEDRLRERIHRVQADGGAYDVELIEAMSDLASYYEAVDRHADAAQLYRDAWQVSRISTGLYSEQQTRILPLLISSYEAVGDWGQVDDFRYLLFHTQSRLYEPGSSEQVAAVRDWGDWRLRAWRQGLIDARSAPGSPLPADLDQLLSLYEHTIDQSEAGQISDEAHIDLLYGRTLTELEIAKHLTRLPARVFTTNVPRYVNRRVCRNVSDQNGAVERMCWTERVQNPNYNSARREEHRRQLSRASLRVSSAANDLDAFLSSSEAIDAVSRQDYRQKLDTMQEELALLQRDVRRASLRSW